MKLRYGRRQRHEHAAECEEQTDEGPRVLHPDDDDLGGLAALDEGPQALLAPQVVDLLGRGPPRGAARLPASRYE